MINASEIAGTNILSLPIENIDTSWMTVAQKCFFDILSNHYDEEKDYKYYLNLSNYKSNKTWYKAINEKRFAELMATLGFIIKKKFKSYGSHSNVHFITNQSEKEKFYKNDIWDIRYLYQDFPRHRSPGHYVINFSKLNNLYIKQVLKKYVRNNLYKWQPVTASYNGKYLVKFFTAILTIFPNLNNLNLLTRDEINEVIASLTCSKDLKRRFLKTTKQMFDYMYINKWDDAPDLNLINKYDIPEEDETIPRPLPPEIRRQIDDYIIQTIIPLLEGNKPTPIIKPKHWDAIIILRYTGRRFEDLCHLVAEGNNVECLKYDKDNDPQLYVDHRIAKIPQDLYVPLAHLNSYTKYGNIVERAILRQMERVSKLPPVNDGFKYLFRAQNANGDIETLNYDYFRSYVLFKIRDGLPLIDYNNKKYNITAHQFRHTVATEMIEAGVDIFAIKEFLGHKSVIMTERYIKIYDEKLKKEFKTKLMLSDAQDIIDKLPEADGIYNNKWVKNKIIGVLELGDGCCEHIYKMPSCPHMSCKTCVKKKIYPRHMQAVKTTIECYTSQYENCISLGLTEKAMEFKKVVDFYILALKVIESGDTFEARKHFYSEGS